MAFKVNYNQQRAERDRAKAAKKEATLREQEELTARRKAGLDTPGEEPVEPAEVGETVEKSDGAA